MICGIADIRNAFQNTFLQPSHKVYITLPPFYKEWFNFRYPRINLPTNVPLCMQTMNGMQGTKYIVRLFWKLIHKLLLSIGYTQITVDNALYVKSFLLQAGSLLEFLLMICFVLIITNNPLNIYVTAFFPSGILLHKLDPFFIT